MKKFNLHHLLSFDSTGKVAPLTTEQLLDKDVKALYEDHVARKDMDTYEKICGVIYYMGDPNSPPAQEGLNEDESLRRAIHDFELPKTWLPTPLISNIIFKYHESEYTILYTSAMSLRRAVRTSIIVADKYNELLTHKLSETQTNVSNKDSLDATVAIVNMLQQIRKEIVEFPKLVEQLKAAEEAIFNDANDVTLRGGGIMSESMNAKLATR